MQRSAAILLIVGSVLFLAGALNPVAFTIWGPDATPATNAEYIESHEAGWMMVNALFALGSVAPVIGLVLFPQQLQNGINGKLAGFIAAILAGIGAVLWVIISYNRISHPLLEVMSNTNTDFGLFQSYTVLTHIALLIVGYVLVRSDYPMWLGIVMLVLAVILLAFFLITGDLPPAANYLPMLIMGIALLFVRLPQTTMN